MLEYIAMLLMFLTLVLTKAKGTSLSESAFDFTDVLKDKTYEEQGNPYHVKFCYKDYR